MADTVDVQGEQCISMSGIFGEEGSRSGYRWDCFFKARILTFQWIGRDGEAETRRRSA